MASEKAIELIESVLNESKGNAYTRSAKVLRDKLNNVNSKVKSEYRDTFYRMRQAAADAALAEKNGDKDLAKEYRKLAVSLKSQLNKIGQKNTQVSSASWLDDTKSQNVPGYDKELGKKYIESMKNKPATGSKINFKINRNTKNPGSYTTKMEAAQILIESLDLLFSDEEDED